MSQPAWHSTNKCLAGCSKSCTASEDTNAQIRLSKLEVRLGLLDRLLSRKVHPDAEHTEAFITQAFEDSKWPQGAYKSAVYGSELRHRFFALVEELEAKLGGPAFGVAHAEDVLMIHPKLREAIRKQPASGLEIALDRCVITKDARRTFNAGWPSLVARYRGKNNSEQVVCEKSRLLASYVIYNLDAAEIASKGLATHRPNNAVEIEEAAVWYRRLDELACQFLGEQRVLFTAFLMDHLFFNLALMGSPPDLIYQTMTARTRQYAVYRQWLPADGDNLKETLIWETGKRVGEPIGLSTNPMFLAKFSSAVADKFMRASVKELFVGE